ncbi:unnamed protein product [Cuscuta epithymum]|uniref:Mce/MlaD domain-containing protein n=1 Tax=Cuscuta epithymum TaxID=186058 RepID=A0AAV0F7M3_9ASTE|nr:unnamed protein product [Cuscuta epithymum]
MLGNSLINVSTNSTMLRILPSRPNGQANFLPPLRTPAMPKSRVSSVIAMSAETGHSQEQIQEQSGPTTERKNIFSVVLDVPRNIWRQTLRPLGDFGFGRRSIWEGGVGLFLVSGAVLLALSLAWLRGFQLRSKFRKYMAVFEFEHASGICTGTPVRIRGVNVGNVIRVNPSLRNIEAVVEVEDDKIIVPRNSTVEVNQSGLLMETVIDITPKDPIPTPTVGPLDQDCLREGLIVCDRQKIKGKQGVSLDALVGIFTRIGREVEEIGVANTFSLAERVAYAIEEARPLLAKIKAMAEDVQPMLNEVRNSGLLSEVESLTKSLTQASEDLRDMHTTVMTPENTELMRKSIYTMVFTLKNIERISSDVLGFTGDEATRRNLKLLIKSLSRLL